MRGWPNGEPFPSVTRPGGAEGDGALRRDGSSRQRPGQEKWTPIIGQCDKL